MTVEEPGVGTRAWGRADDRARHVGSAHPAPEGGQAVGIEGGYAPHMPVLPSGDPKASQAGIEIRPAAPDELDMLSAAFPDRPRVLHEERLLHQEEGHGPYLIAWDRGEPVGHIQVQLPDDRDLDSILEGRGAAWGEDLWVRPEARGRWVGPALMRGLEREARRARAPGVVFFVGVDQGYAAARAIYRWMGWRERHAEPFIESATLERDDGGSDVYVEVITMWEKRLA